MLIQKKAVFKWTAILSVAIGLMGTRSALAQQEEVTLDSGFTHSVYSSSTMTTANLLAVGDVLALGYYTGATANNSANDFKGTFIPLSGPTVSNSTYSGTTIGEGGSAGTYSFTLYYSNPTSGVTLPAPGTPLVIRFYNASSIASSTAYNDVTSATLWQWNAPANPTATTVTTLDDTPIEWLGPAFYTSVPITVPEPSTLAASAVALGGFAFIHLRRRRAA